MEPAEVLNELVFIIEDVRERLPEYPEKLIEAILRRNLQVSKLDRDVLRNFIRKTTKIIAELAEHKFLMNGTKEGDCIFNPHLDDAISALREQLRTAITASEKIRVTLPLLRPWD